MDDEYEKFSDYDKKMWDDRRLPRPVTRELLEKMRAGARASELEQQREYEQATKPIDDACRELEANGLLADERKNKRWTIKEQAHQIGLDRGDFYKALKRQLPDAKKLRRFDEYVARLRSEAGLQKPSWARF